MRSAYPLLIKSRPKNPTATYYLLASILQRLHKQILAKTVSWTFLLLKNKTNSAPFHFDEFFRLGPPTGTMVDPGLTFAKLDMASIKHFFTCQENDKIRVKLKKNRRN